MKSAGRLLNEHRQTIVPSEVQLEFLHCNAHFLLALSSAADRSATRVAGDEGLHGTLGREQLAAFNNFSCTRSAVCRYIWMCCGTLGPRADEKNGCQGDWLAYCASIQKTNKISSFRDSRFNNLFAAASALGYHRQDILNFFLLKEPSNLKQRSVQADAACDTLNIFLLDLAMMHIFVTGPFWVFVRSDTHFLDQHTYIQPMHRLLKEAQQHPEVLMDDALFPQNLPAVQIREEPAAKAVLKARRSLCGKERRILLSILSPLAEEFVVVVERQLSCFLSGGRYGSPPSETDRERMAHCQLTNLVEEACFADLDYSMFKNRKASLHPHSTLNMAKRNATVSKWLNGKSSKEQAALMAKARKLGPMIQKKSRQQEIVVLNDLQAVMEKKKDTEESQRRWADKTQKEKEAVLCAVNSQNGPCKSPDVLRLVREARTKAAKVKALKAQVDYKKLVLGSSSPELRTTKVTLQDLCSNFLLFKFGVEAAEENIQNIADVCSVKITKKRKLEEAESDSESNEGTSGSSTSDEEESLPHEDVNFQFSFAHQGHSVAVFYDAEFYIGQVLDVSCPDLPPSLS